MLVYWKKSLSLSEFGRMLEWLLVANCVDIIPRDLYYDLANVSPNKLLKHMEGYTQVANEQTYLSGSQIHHV